MSYSHQKTYGWPHLLFALVLLVVLTGIIIPLLPGNFTRSAGPRTEALNNAKAIAGGLVTFKTDHGAYPCAYTRKELEEKGIGNLPPGNSANAYLAQLVVTEIIDSETYFYATGMPGAIKGDDYIGSPDKLLAKGENGFAYIMTTDEEALSDVKSITPLVIAPIIKGGKKPTFNPIPYKDYYVYGAVDGSGKQGKISPTGQAMSKDRDHLFATGPTSLFGEETPVIKLPLGSMSSLPTPSKKQNWHYILYLIPLAALLWLISLAFKSPAPES